MIEDAHESRYETNVDYSFFTEPVSCEVHNKVGSTNVSTLVNVHCEWLEGQGWMGRAGTFEGSGVGVGGQGTGRGRWQGSRRERGSARADPP